VLSSGPWPAIPLAPSKRILLAAAGGLDATEVRTEVRGQEGENSFRRFFLDKEGHEISPWHDLPLRADAANEFWMVTETLGG